MDINITVKVFDEVNNVTVYVRALKQYPPYNDYKVKLSRQLDLTPGERHISFTTPLPSCSSCSKLKPGEHYVNVTISYDEQTVTGSHVIELRER